MKRDHYQILLILVPSLGLIHTLSPRILITHQQSRFISSVCLKNWVSEHWQTLSCMSTQLLLKVSLKHHWKIQMTLDLFLYKKYFKIPSIHHILWIKPLSCVIFSSPQIHGKHIMFDFTNIPCELFVPVNFTKRTEHYERIIDLCQRTAYSIFSQK